MVQLYLVFFIFFGMIGSLYADENQDNAKLTNTINATIKDSQATLSADLAAKQQDISTDISKQID